mgnify:CR=1 FL=1
MGVQTSYNYGISKGMVGGLYDISYYENNTFITPGGIPFGYGVVKGANPGVEVKLPDTGSKAADFEGIVQNGFTTMQDMNGKAIPEKGSSIGVLRIGKIWGAVGAAATPAYDKPVYLITDGDEAGRFTTEEDTATKILLPLRFINEKDDDIAPIRVTGQVIDEKEVSKS